MKFLFATGLLILISSAALPQKKGKPSAAKPVIRATVTVKGDSTAPPPVYPAETDEGIWNEFASKNERLKVLLPARAKNVEWSYEDIRGAEAAFLTTRSKSARYQVVTRPSIQFESNRDIEDVLEASIQTAYSPPKSGVRVKRTIYYDGVLGKEFEAVYQRAEVTVVDYVRCFILDSKMIIMSVSVEKPVDDEKLRPWNKKFFDSLIVPRNGKKDA